MKMSPADESRARMGDVSGIEALCAPGTFQVADNGENWAVGAFAETGLRFSLKVGAATSSPSLGNGRIRELAIWDDAERQRLSDYDAACLVVFDLGWQKPPRTEAHLRLVEALLRALGDAVGLEHLPATLPAIPESASGVVLREQRRVRVLDLVADDAGSDRVFLAIKTARRAGTHLKVLCSGPDADDRSRTEFLLQIDEAAAERFLAEIGLTQGAGNGDAAPA